MTNKLIPFFVVSFSSVISVLISVSAASAQYAQNQPAPGYAPNGSPVGNSNMLPGQAEYMRRYPASNNNMHSSHGTRDAAPPASYSGSSAGSYNGGYSGGYNGGNPPSVGVSDSTTQMRRWEQQWRDEHPGEPMPNMGQLQKMHIGEIQAQVQRGGQAMWAKRQADLRQNYSAARNMQIQKNAQNHQNWTAQQWSDWDRQYNASQKAQADAYLEGVRMSGQMAREEEFRRRNGFVVPGSVP